MFHFILCLSINITWILLFWFFPKHMFANMNLNVKDNIQSLNRRRKIAPVTDSKTNIFVLKLVEIFLSYSFFSMSQQSTFFFNSQADYQKSFSKISYESYWINSLQKPQSTRYEALKSVFSKNKWANFFPKP